MVAQNILSGRSNCCCLILKVIDGHCIDLLGSVNIDIYIAGNTIQYTVKHFHKDRPQVHCKWSQTQVTGVQLFITADL